MYFNNDSIRRGEV